MAESKADLDLIINNPYLPQEVYLALLFPESILSKKLANEQMDYANAKNFLEMKEFLHMLQLTLQDMRIDLVAREEFRARLIAEEKSEDNIYSLPKAASIPVGELPQEIKKLHEEHAQAVQKFTEASIKWQRVALLETQEQVTELVKDKVEFVGDNNKIIKLADDTELQKKLVAVGANTNAPNVIKIATQSYEKLAEKNDLDAVAPSIPKPTAEFMHDLFKFNKEFALLRVIYDNLYLTETFSPKQFLGFMYGNKNKLAPLLAENTERKENNLAQIKDLIKLSLDVQRTEKTLDGAISKMLATLKPADDQEYTLRSRP